MQQHVLEINHLNILSPYDEANGQIFLLKDIGLKVRQGQWLSVLGANGSGKSTLARAIAGFRMQEADGEVIRPAGDRPIPIVLQQPDAAILGATPWEDVLLMLEQHGGEEEHMQKRAEEALASAGLHDHMHQPIATLSGGQKQLTAIAGCLAVEPPLLVLDEVTSMLHPDTAAEVHERVRRLNRQGTTVIWITQNVEELRGEDRVVILDKGEIVYDGDTDGVFCPAAEQNGESICERLGFEAPYCVQVARELNALGLPLGKMPLTPEELAAYAAAWIGEEGEDGN